MMKSIYPDYYKNFKCIADKCKHSCCVGWEIDIDEGTFRYYESLDTEFSKRFDTAISHEGTPHFVLDKDGRCPFLNKNGLCDIISEFSHDALCDICYEHPRFRNYYSNCVELGVGLSCEAAAELILKNDKCFSLINFDLNDSCYNARERKNLAIRSKLIDIVINRSISVSERHNELLDFIGFKFNKKEISKWRDFYLSLERLDDKWTDMLNSLKDKEDNLNCSEREIALEQLTVYFLYRHILPDLSYDDIRKIVAFSILSVNLIDALSCLNGDIVECARMYSAEIEYSDENVKKICDEFSI